MPCHINNPYIYIYNETAAVWPEDALGLVSVQAQHFLRQTRLNPRQLAVGITVLLHRHHFLQRRAEHGGPEDGVPSVSDLLDRGLVQTLRTESTKRLRKQTCGSGYASNDAYVGTPLGFGAEPCFVALSCWASGTNTHSHTNSCLLAVCSDRSLRRWLKSRNSHTNKRTSSQWSSRHVRAKMTPVAHQFDCLKRAARRYGDVSRAISKFRKLNVN